MATSRIIPPSLLLFLIRTCLRPPRHSTIKAHITRYRRRRCHGGRGVGGIYIAVRVVMRWE